MKIPWDAIWDAFGRSSRTGGRTPGGGGNPASPPSGGGGSTISPPTSGFAGSISGRTCAALYRTAAGNTYATGGSAKILDFETKVYDTLSTVTTGAAFKFTAPRSGYVIVCCHILAAASADWAVGEDAALTCYKNGAVYGLLDYDMNMAANSAMALSGSIAIEVSTKDYIDVRFYQASGGNITLNSTGTYSWISFTLV